jgi:hypothetical protein
LRQAIFALNIIEERGDRDVFSLIMREVNEAMPATDDLDNLTLGARIRIRTAGDELAQLLGAPAERCRHAALDVMGPGRQRLRFQALVRYAIDLIGPCRELTGESIFTDYEPPATNQLKTAVPAPIRLTLDTEATK